MRHYFTIIFLFLFLKGNLVFPQDKYTDSIIGLCNKTSVDTQKIYLLANIAGHFQSLGDYLSAVKYYRKINNEFSKQYPLKGIDCKNRIAFQYIYLEEYDKVDSVLKETLEESEKLNYFKGMGFSYRFKAAMYMFKGDYKNATNWYLKAQHVWEKTGNQAWITLGNSDLGNNFYSLQNHEKAIFYWKNSLKTNPDTSSLDYIGDCSNLAQVYLEIDSLNTAEGYLKKCFNYYSNKKEQTGYTNTLSVLAALEERKKNYTKALEYILDAIKINEENNSGNAVLSRNYISAGLIYLKLSKIKEAIEYAEKGYEKAKLSEQKPILLNAYSALYWTYSKAENYEKAFHYFELYSDLKDALNNIENQKQINELDKQYQTEKKDKDNLLLSKQLEIQQIQSKQQQFFLLVSGIVVVLIAVLSIILYRQNKQKQRANHKLEEKNKIIEEQHKDIIDSINYAKRIQQAILKEEEHVSAHLPPHFILFKPKDIVSGDFYWALEKAEYLYITAADCTGHGVPGAFLTMLGISYLNEINAREEILTPAEILDQLRDKIVKELSRYGKTKDGMDISLMRLNLKTNEVMWAGAFNPLWYIENGILKEIKANKQPIGYVDDQKPFTNHTLQLKLGDTVYLFTDGFADQFGGPKGKKYKYKQLEENLIANNHKTFEEQKIILKNNFNAWKGNLEQVDDVTVIGISITS